MFKNKVLIFAGTSEGYSLAQFVKDKGLGEKVTFSVATEYGKEGFDELEGINVVWGRMTPEQMETTIVEQGYTLVLDSTHPYAKEATANIKQACKNTGIEYVRLYREELTLESFPQKVQEKIHLVDSIEAAVDLLNNRFRRDKVLLTTGSKEIGKFVGIEDFQERVYPRVLPFFESLTLCKDANVPSKNIIAMQGPFTGLMNRATMDQYGCKVLVSKSTGKAGGFDDKLLCAEDGFDIIVIKRPTLEQGLSLEEAKSLLENLLEDGK